LKFDIITLKRLVYGCIVTIFPFLVGFVVNLALDVNTLKADSKSDERMQAFYMKSVDDRLERIETKLDNIL